MTWTALRREEHFHFPVDAVDYLFGMTVNYRLSYDSITFCAVRLRFSHISAHLADGSYDKVAGSWRDGRVPEVYSREFIELIGAIEFGENLRLYGGGHYVYHIDPGNLFPWMLRAGLEVAYTPPRPSWFHSYFAYDVRLAGGGKPVGNHSFQGGIKFGAWNGTGIRVFLTYFNGLSPHGEYHDIRISSWGSGFSIDF
ncbi:MAG: DUF1207 domain-containing protein [Bacteroidota bacterium]|nr:DUF1207 domain-containing protein [Bacteroidota bacterium]